MSFEVSSKALNASSQGAVTPQIVLRIEGFDELFTAVELLGVIRYGDDISYGDAGLYYGQLLPEQNTYNLISYKGGTTTAIKQQLNADKGIGDSISSIRVALVDKDQFVTQNILTPDETVSPAKDILGRRAKLYLGFYGTEFPDDYFVIFRGNIDQVESRAGLITLGINHPDSKKRSALLAPAATKLNGSINSSVTTLTVDDTSSFLNSAYTGPSGAIDTTFQTLIRIDNEVIRYTGKTATTFTGCTRGYFATTAASHSDNAEVTSINRFYGNAMDIALKLMLSGWGGYFEEGVVIKNFVRISDTETVSNSIFFYGVDIVSEYNLQIGDYITTTGATNGANNVSLKAVNGITRTDSGSYIIIDGVSFVEEADTAGTVSFRSQYDTYPDGAKMHNDEVDITEHLKLKGSFLTDDVHYDFRVRDEINLKEFLGEQVYNPLSAYSVPKNAKSSVGYHIDALLPTQEIPVFDTSNVIEPKNIILSRSISKNFFNTIIYKFDQDIFEPDRYLNTLILASATSYERINTGIKALTVESAGLRTDEAAVNLATLAGNRRLGKFRFGAETLKGVRVNFETGFRLEIGDVVLVKMAELQISDIKTGSRNGDPRLFEIINKELDIKSGKVIFELIDPNFSEDTRFGLISPSSFVDSGLSTTVFNIRESYNHPYGVDEYKLWANYIGATVVVRNSDYSVSDESVIFSISGNQITVSPALSFTPASDYIMELGSYDGQTDVTKLLYTFMQDSPTFADGKIQYTML